MQPRLSSGFTLVEVLVALALLVVVSVGVVRCLPLRSTPAVPRAIAPLPSRSQRARSSSFARWSGASSWIPAGVLTPHTDTSSNLSLDSVGAGGPGLTESPAGTLDTNMPPYVDYLDRHRPMGRKRRVTAGECRLRPALGDSSPARRSRIAVVVLQVFVATVQRERARRGSAPHAWNGEDVLLATLMMRRVR